MSYRKYKISKNYSTRESSYSGGAPRISRLVRNMNDFIIGNQASGQFAVFDTNGAAAPLIDSITMGGTNTGWNNSARFGVNLSIVCDELAQWPDISRMYAQFRVTGVKITIIPLSTTSVVNNTSQIGECSFAYNPLDLPPANDENVVMQWQGVKTRRLDKPFSFFIKPHARTTSYDATGNALQAVAQMNNPWLDTIIGGQVEHYGAMMYFNNIYNANPASASVGFKVRRTVYLEAKDTF